MHPSIGIEVFRIDLVKAALVVTQGELKELPMTRTEVSDGQISFEHEGRIQTPELREVFKTTISRITGRWTRVAVYYDRTGNIILQPELGKIAGRLGLLTPIGIRQFTSQGECKADDRKF